MMMVTAAIMTVSLGQGKCLDGSGTGSWLWGKVTDGSKKYLNRWFQPYKSRVKRKIAKGGSLK